MKKRIINLLKYKKRYLQFILIVIVFLRITTVLIFLFFSSKTYQKIERRGIKIARKIKKPKIKIVIKKMVKVREVSPPPIFSFFSINIYIKDIVYILLMSFSFFGVWILRS